MNTQIGSSISTSYGKPEKLSLFLTLETLNIHSSSVIYKCTYNCDCEKSYIGETARNFEVRRNEHSNVSKQSEPARNPEKGKSLT